MKRVLILTFDFPPQGGVGVVRVTKFVKYLPLYGWEPVVVTSDTLWNPDPSLLAEIPPEVPVYRVPWPATLKRLLPQTAQAALGSPAARPGLSGRMKQAAKRWLRALILPDLTRLWTYGARGVCRQALADHPCDAMVSTSPPNAIHLLGRWIHEQTGLPWVADFRDVWSVADSPWMLESGPVNRWRHRQLERGVLRTCQRAVVMTEAIAERTTAVFGPWVAHKLSVIPNGFDAADFAIPASPSPKDELEVLYLGSIVQKRTQNALPEGLRLAWEQYREALQGVRVRFIGLLDPGYAQRLRAAAPLVELESPMPHKEAVQRMQNATALLLVQGDSVEERMIYSSKFYEYLAAQKPMLGIVPEGVARDFILREGIGTVAHPDRPQEIAEALVALVTALRTDANRFRPAPELVARFERRALTGELAKVLDEIAVGG